MDWVKQGNCTKIPYNGTRIHLETNSRADFSLIPLGTLFFSLSASLFCFIDLKEVLEFISPLFKYHMLSGNSKVERSCQQRLQETLCSRNLNSQGEQKPKAEPIKIQGSPENREGGSFKLCFV